MSGISQTFSRLRESHEGALIPYITIGDPNSKKTPLLVDALIQGGADIVELGIPFSDPIADGPTIQNAVSRSLTSGTKPEDAFEIAQRVHERHETPLVLMTYYNPALKFGLANFLKRARESGISGLIVPDLPVEEAVEHRAMCGAAGIDMILLASPSTGPSRLKQIVDQTSGYLYLVSLYGVTGIRATLGKSALKLVTDCRKAMNGAVPLAAGFGISHADHVKQIIAAGADAAIVGSAFVRIIEENRSNMARAARRLATLARAMKKAARSRASGR